MQVRRTPALRVELEREPLYAAREVRSDERSTRRLERATIAEMASETHTQAPAESSQHPWLRALLLAALVFVTALGLLALAAAGSPPGRLDAGYRSSATVLTTILAFTAGVLSTHGASRRREPILALLPASDPARNDWPPILPGRQRLAVIAAGSVLGIAIIPLFENDPGLYFRADRWNPLLVWSITLNALLFSTLGVLALMGIREDAYIEARVVPRVPIDLLALGPLSAFGRRGVLTASFWLIGSSLASLLFLNYPFSIAHATIIAGTLGLGVAALLRPIRGIRRRIRDAKEEELARVRAALRDERGRLLESGEAGRAAAARMPGLVAWEQRIAELSTWPIDVSSTLRFAALGAIAVGSWVGGAMIERFLEVVLG